MRWGAIMLVLATAVFFVWRGPMRGLVHGHDLMSLWAAGRAVLAGDNPYHYDALVRAALSGGMLDAAEQGPERLICLYPPGTAFLMAPLGGLPWHTARLIVNLANTVAVGGLAFLLVRWRRVLMGPSAMVGGNRGRFYFDCLLVGITLMWAPIHACINLGNISILVALAGLWAVSPFGRWSRWAWVVLGLAMALKPQFAGPLVLVWVWQRRWRPAGAALILGGGITVMAALVMQAIHPTWLTDLRANLQHFTHDGIGNPTRDYGWAFTMIDWAPLLHLFFDGRGLVKALAWIMTFALVVPLVVSRAGIDQAKATPPSELDVLNVICIVAILTQLPVYHRAYDAVLILPVVLLALSRWEQGQQRVAHGAVLLGCGLFVLPWSAVAIKLLNTGDLPEVMGANPWLRALTLHHATLGLAAMAILLGRYGNDSKPARSDVHRQTLPKNEPRP